MEKRSGQPERSRGVICGIEIRRFLSSLNLVLGGWVWPGADGTFFSNSIISSRRS